MKKYTLLELQQMWIRAAMIRMGLGIPPHKYIKEKDPVQWNGTIVDEDYAGKGIKLMREPHVDNSKYFPHQGKQECMRRLRQTEAVKNLEKLKHAVRTP